MTSQLLLPSYAYEAEKKKDTDWLLTPARTAVHLSRGKWIRTRHLDLISNEVSKLKDHPIFLIVTLPPRHGKSSLISHWTPVWFLKAWPHKRVILASYQTDFAADWGGDTKNTITENVLELGLELMQDTKAKHQWRIKGHGGGMTATGIGGSLTGRGGDLIVIDDPVKSQKEALSETYRRTTKQWYQATLRSRLQPNGSIIIIMTRWHEDDLVGWLLSETSEEVKYKDDWKVINMPAFAESDDVLGRKEGQVLWPGMYSRESLLASREAVGPYWWSAQYMGSPRPEGGAILKEAWFQYFTDEDDPLENDEVKILRCLQFWDTAFKKDQQNDRSACCTWIETNKGYFLHDVWVGRPEFPELVEIVKAKYRQYIPDQIQVEDKASGQSLIQQLRRDTRLPIKAIKAVDDKTIRVNSIAGIVEAGRVFLPSRAPWLSEFLHEVCSFPSAMHDDITDAFAYGLMAMKPQRVIGGRSSVSRGKKQSTWRD